MEETYYVDWENCEYCFVSYEESDIGYKEYGCELDGKSCEDVENCPMTCKYTVTRRD